MNKTDINLLYQYDRWANARILKALASLTAEQFARDLGGSFGSLRGTILHLVGGEWIWLEYWKNPPTTPEALSRLQAQRDARFSPALFPEVAAVERIWAEVEKSQIAFVNGLNDELLHGLIPFRSGQIELVLLMQHVANHSTYHRGQLALMMRQLVAEPTATDFHVFLADNLVRS